MTRSVFVLNGPNLNMLGRREPHLYGHTTLTEIEEQCAKVAEELGLEMFFAQTSDEAKLIDWVHEACIRPAGIVINPAGLSFTSVALIDALKILDQPIIEVHITNIFKREPIYHTSLVSRVATGMVCGWGAFGYQSGLRAIANHYQMLDRIGQP